MSGWTRRYIHAVRTLFPLLGRSERRFLRQLAASIDDHFHPASPGSLEEISAVFGAPEEVRDTYFTQCDSDYLFQELRHIQRLQRLAWSGVALLAVVCIVMFCFFQWDHAALDHYYNASIGYFVESIQ